MSGMAREEGKEKAAALAAARKGGIVPELPAGIEEQVAKGHVGYLASTHFKYWVFTPAQLASIKETTHERAMERFAEEDRPTPGLSTTVGTLPRAGRPPMPPSPGDVPMTAASPARPAVGTGGGSAPAGLATPQGAMGDTDMTGKASTSRARHRTPDDVSMSPSPGMKRKSTPDGDVAMHTPSKRSTKKQRRTASEFRPLSSREEDTLKRHFELQIRSVCEEIKCSHYIMATATLFFKRFFLFKTVLDIAPQDIMLPSIFLAIKAEASPFGEVEDIVKRLKNLLSLEDEKLVEHEMLLLMGNRFHLTVYHPYRALLALARKLQTALSKAVDATTASTTLSCVYTRALELVHWSMTTDCPLLYHPGQIAAAAMSAAMDDSVAIEPCQHVGLPALASKGVDAEAFLSSIFSAGDASPQQQAANKAAAQHARSLILQALAVPRLNAEAKKLNKRRKRCSNPAYLKGTPEFNARMKKKEEDRIARKAAKLQQARAAAAASK